MTFSSECIYNESHPEFHHMQHLLELLKGKDLVKEEKEELVKEKAKLSLYRPDLYDDYFNNHIHKKISPVRLNFFSRELHTFDVTKKLSLIESPTVIACGRFDVQCPLSYSVEMNEGIPNSTLLIFEESNHYPHLEEQEKFSAKVVNRFD